MKKFVVSYIDFFDNDLTSVIIEASNEFDSMIKYLEQYQNVELYDHPKIKDENDIKEFCFNCDAMINSIKI